MLKSLDHFRGIADGDGVGGDVMCNNRSGSYGTIIADGDAGQDGHIPADPYIIAILGASYVHADRCYDTRSRYARRVL